MKITELAKIIKQIQKYQLWGEIENVVKWIKGLTNKEVDNFIKLNVELTKPIIEYKYLLISLLNSDYYLQDMESLSKAKTDTNVYYLRLVAWDPISLYSGYHADDMDLISNAKTDEIADCLMVVACNINSLKSKHHTKDMELISNAKTDYIADCLCDVACDTNSLKSKHHAKDMDLISNANPDDIAYYLSLVACNPDSLNSDDHTTDMEQIANAKDDAEAEERYQTIMNKYKTPDKRQLTNEEKKDIIKYVDNDESKELPNEAFKIAKNPK